MTLPQKIASIHNLQAELEAFPEEFKIDPPLKHHFAPGAYAREIFLPKGSLVVGKIHKHSHLNIISYGDVCVATFEGVERYQGHNVLVSSAGVKRVVYAVEDTVWTTIHLTEETDLKKIEDEIIAESYDEIDFLEKMKEKLELL